MYIDIFFVRTIGETFKFLGDFVKSPEAYGTHENAGKMNSFNFFHEK